MSITRFNEFIAQPGKLAELTQAFVPVLRKIRTAKGCESCDMFIAVEGSERIIIIEQWTDVNSHQAAAKLVVIRIFKLSSACWKARLPARITPKWNNRGHH
jgi:quinol monooxygenase YgiN